MSEDREGKADHGETHDEALFDTEPSPQPESVAPMVPAGSAPHGGPPSIADGQLRGLDPRHVTLSRIIGAIITAVVVLNVVIGSPIVLLIVPLDLGSRLAIIGAAAVCAVLLGWFAWAWPVLEHRHMSYRVESSGLEIRRGVVWRKVINVPRSRVQHTDVSQGPVERRFDLATLHVYTAGTEHSKIELPGLSHATALAVRDHLAAGGEDDAV